MIGRIGTGLLYLALIAPVMAADEVSDPAQSIEQANAVARVEPALADYTNSMQIWAYSPAALYQLYTMPGRVSDIALQPGEELIDISTPDSVRWIVGTTTSGEGLGRRIHVSIKPTRADLQTNLVIYTSRRTYYLEVHATPGSWIAAVSWNYPPDKIVTTPLANVDKAAAAPAERFQPERINFKYRISGAKVPWRPLRVFDDGEKVYIHFADSIAQTDMPPLFLRGANGDPQLLNYRVRSPYYIVDRLFDAAELRLGGRKARVVHVARADQPTRDEAQGVRR
jgi:P-type conjugative transfer protein TrbG